MGCFNGSKAKHGSCDQNHKTGERERAQLKVEVCQIDIQRETSVNWGGGDGGSVLTGLSKRFYIKEDSKSLLVLLALPVRIEAIEGI